jgi:hypothetical protein
MGSIKLTEHSVSHYQIQLPGSSKIGSDFYQASDNSADSASFKDYPKVCKGFIRLCRLPGILSHYSGIECLPASHLLAQDLKSQMKQRGIEGFSSYLFKNERSFFIIDRSGGFQLT